MKMKKIVTNWILKTMKSKNKKIDMTNCGLAITFHSKSDNKWLTLNLDRNTKGSSYGGLTSQNWASRYNNSNDYVNSNINDPNVFLFSLEYKDKYSSYDDNQAQIILPIMVHLLEELMIYVFQTIALKIILLVILLIIIIVLE